MGKIEKESRHRTRRNEMKEVMLHTVAVAGLMAVAVVAPNAVGAMVKLGVIPSRRQREYANASRNRLLKQGLLVLENGFLRLTAKGERELRRLQLQKFGMHRPKRWDKKWRVLVFDIPEYRKKLREQIRHSLGSIGFRRLQDSVWVYPYDCEDLIMLLKADFHVGKDLLYMIVDSIENDRHLLTEFGLTSQ